MELNVDEYLQEQLDAKLSLSELKDSVSNLVDNIMLDKYSKITTKINVWVIHDK